MRTTVGSVALVAPIDVKVPFTSMHTTKLNVCTNYKYNNKFYYSIVSLFKKFNLYRKMIPTGTPENLGGPEKPRLFGERRSSGESELFALVRKRAIRSLLRRSDEGDAPYGFSH